MQAHSQEGQTARSPRLLLEAVSGGAWTRGAFARSASQGATQPRTSLTLQGHASGPVRKLAAQRPLWERRGAVVSPHRGVWVALGTLGQPGPSLPPGGASLMLPAQSRSVMGSQVPGVVRPPLVTEVRAVRGMSRWRAEAQHSGEALGDRPRLAP